MNKKELVMKCMKWIVVLICLILVIGILEDVLDKEIHNLDVSGYNFVSKYLISDTMTPIVKIITQFGGIVVLVTVAIISLIVIKNKKIGVLICANLAISAGLNQILKYIIQRPRPVEYRIIDESGYSFPSGHSMVSAAFYGFLIYLIYKKVKNKALKYTLIISLSILILLIGTSRIYLGVHYTSDVIAGILISIIYLIIFGTFGTGSILH